MKITIRPVAQEYISQTWPMVKDYIQESIDKGLANGSPDYNLDHIQLHLTSGQWALIVAVDEGNSIQGAMTMSFINYPLHRVAFVTSTGGKGIIDKGTFGQLVDIAKHYGATKIQAMARPSMARLLQTCEFKAGNILMEHEL